MSNHDSDKGDVEHVEVSQDNINVDETGKQKVLRKIDVRLLPVLTLLYVFAFLDRSNIGNAKIAGMTEDLNLSGAQYNMALTVFFFPYGVFEVPSNMVLKITKPSHWICFLMVCWGIVMTCQGLVKNYDQLIVTRVLLGLFESGFFPAASYLVTTWYCRFEVQTRMAIFYGAACIASAFSGILAFAIQKMDGIGGLDGWRWIFIVEGLATVVIAVLTPWLLVDSPETCSFLSPDEKAFVVYRLAHDSGHTGTEVGTSETFQWRYLKSALTDWKLYCGIVIFWGNTISLYGYTYSVPTIIQGLGYSSANAQLLTVPPYIVGVISIVAFSWLSDSKQIRWISIIFPYAIACVGLIALLAIPPRLPGLTYAFLFTIPAGASPPIMGLLSWFGNNLAPSWKRAIGMALVISVGNLGGAVGSNIFLREQAPRYWLGYGFSLGIVLAAMVCAVILKVTFSRKNAIRERMDESAIRAKYSAAELVEMGDKNPLYRYVI
ncbi:major facilitator superfamily domain-containing protein [Aspergillus ambiguus]|uniref:major facilitator superfamily domain-containing protein n=1 Tax=Aspergillus ambiguus TaxID=176160 RepID=UPI003CCD1905